MAAYSVAQAKNHLPKLINEALKGEEVVITRHGKPVIEMRPRVERPKSTREEMRRMDEWIIQRRNARPNSSIGIVELLNEMYEGTED